MKTSLLCLILLIVAASIQTAPAQERPPFFGSNLIVNSGAEAGGAPSGNPLLVRPIPGWIPEGNFTIESYAGTGGGFPALFSPGPPNRGTKFFSGGPDNAGSSATQDIQIPSLAFTAIDAGTVKYNLSAWLGGFGSQDDSAALTIRFNQSATTVTLGPVLAQDRQSVTGLINRAVSGSVPPGTRSIQVTLTTTRKEGNYNDGYADDLSLILTPAIASCTVNAAVPPSLRAEGATELIGDIVLACTGGIPTAAGVPVDTADITIILAATVTSRLKSIQGSTASESLLIIDEPGSSAPGSGIPLACASASGCTIAGTGSGVGTYSGATGRPNIFQGVATSNVVTFAGVPIDPPGGAGNVTRTFRFTNIRVNASARPPSGSTPGRMGGAVRITGATTLVLNDPEFVGGFVQPALRFSLRDGSNATTLSGSASITPGSGPIPSGPPSAFLRFAEGFQTAFKTRTTAPYAGTETSPAPATQSSLGTIYNSESGLTFVSPSITVPPADSGTRFKAAFNNLPAGVSVWVGTTNSAGVPPAAARLIASEVAAFTPVPASAIVGAFAVAQVPLVNGSGTATWEALLANAPVNDNYDFPVWFTGSSPVSLFGTFNGSLAPNPAQGAISGVTSASSSLPIPRFIDTATPAASQVLAHIADGGAWKTTIILVNTDTSPASFTLRFWDESGNAWRLPLGQDGIQSQVTGTIPVGGSRTIQTDGIAGALSVGSAELVSSNSIGGSAIFALQTPGQPDSEAAVPVTSTPARRFLLPFDNSPGSATGVAIANPNTTQNAIVSVVFRDPSGQQTGTAGPYNVAARGHISFVLPSSAGTRGVAEFTSPGVDVAGLGIRGRGRAFTSVEALSGVPLGGKTISHIADGGGWKTTVILVNTDSQPAPFTVRFWQDSGAALPLSLGADGTRSELSGTIAPGGSRIIETDGTAAALATGWAELTTSFAIGGTAIFGAQVPGQPDSEAAVPIVADSARRLVLPFDGSPGFATGVAFANPNVNQSANISVIFRDESGQQIGQAGPYLTPARGHTSVVLPVTRRGVAEISSPDAAISALGIRSHNGAFTSVKTLIPGATPGNIAVGAELTK